MNVSFIINYFLKDIIRQDIEECKCNKIKLLSFDPLVGHTCLIFHVLERFVHQENKIACNPCPMSYTPTCTCALSRLGSNVLETTH